MKTWVCTEWSMINRVSNFRMWVGKIGLLALIFLSANFSCRRVLHWINQINTTWTKVQLSLMANVSISFTWTPFLCHSLSVPCPDFQPVCPCLFKQCSFINTSSIFFFFKFFLDGFFFFFFLVATFFYSSIHILQYLRIKGVWMETQCLTLNVFSIICVYVMGRTDHTSWEFLLQEIYWALGMMSKIADKRSSDLAFYCLS